jgi:hypothetical protein
MITQEDLKTIRERGYSDDEIWSKLAETNSDFSTIKERGYSLEEVVSITSGKPMPEPEPADTSIGDTLQKTAEELEAGVGRAGSAFAKSAVGSVRMITDLFGANNAVSKEIAGVEDYIDQFTTAQAKQDKQEISRLFQEAEGKGLGNKVMAGLKAVAVSPETLGPEMAGYMLPSLAAGLLTGGASIPVQIGTQATIGAAQAAGSIKGDIYQSVRDYSREQGLSEVEADRAATEAQSYGGKNLDLILTNAGIGALAASTGAERIATRILTGRGQDVTKKTLGEFLKQGAAAGGVEALTEGTQEAAEQISQNIALQRQGKDVPTFQNVPQVATMGAVSGGVIGGGLKGVEFLSAEEKEERDINRSAEMESRSLSTTDATTKKVINDLNQSENAINSLRDELDTLEPTDPRAQQLRMQISEEQKKATGLKQSIGEEFLSETITEAEKQQIELAKAITAPVAQAAPEVAAPVTEAITPPAEEKPAAPVTAPVPKAPTEPPVFMVGKQVIPGVTPVPVVAKTKPAPTEPTVNQSLTVAPVEEEPFGKLPTAEVETGISQRAKEAAIAEEREKIEAPIRRQESINQFLSEGATVKSRTNVVGRKKAAEGGGDITKTAYYLAHPDGKREITLSKKEASDLEAPAITPAPVAETPAVTEAPAAEVAPAEEGQFSIYQMERKDGMRWLVQSGEKRGFGDAIFNTKEDAEKYASDEKLRQQQRASMVEREAQIKRDEEAAKELREKNVNEFTTAIGATPIAAGKIKKTLMEKAAKRTGGKVYEGTRAEIVEQFVAIGFKPTIAQVDAVKDLTRAQFNRMDNRQQAEFEKKKKAAGKKNEYRLENAEGYLFDVTKAEYDYANWLESRTEIQPTAAVSETITPAAEPAGISVGNRIKLGKSPQTYIVEEVVPQSEVEKANDEQYYSVRNEKTGEVQVVEKADMKQVSKKPKLGEKGGVLIPSREDFIQAGQNIYEAGMEFGTWAKQMIQQFGDVVREFLGEVWQAVSGAPAKLNEVMGYLPKKGEGGELSFGKTGKLKRYTDKGTIVKLAIKQEKDTPKGILSETIKIIKQRVFDGDSTPSESATKKAWGFIERLKATNPDAKNNAEAINQLTRETMQEVNVAEDATEAERNAFEVIKQTVGMSKLRNELYKYAIKLAGQGDNSMLNYLLNNSLNIAGTSIATEEDIARALGALAGLKSYIIQANEAEQAGFIQLAAQRFFNTTTPTEDQIAKIKRILTAVNETKVNEEEAILEELTQVGEKIGTELVENINTQIDKASKPEVKDPMVAAITAMLKLGGTFVYRKTKNKIKAAVEKTIKGGITNYRDKLVEGAANGLETGFWKTLASEQKRIGPLGELDAAQNRELGNIVKSTLVSMKLQGKLGKPLSPDEKKMDIYEQVASILGEKPLSQDKIKLADEKIRGEINSKRQNELEQTEDQDVQDAINLKYDQIEKAWDMAMSQQLDMPVSDAMLRRLIFNELKEGKTSVAKLATLMNEEPTIGASRQDRIVSSIINKIAGVTFEGQNPADYTALKEYLSNQLESLVREKQTENKVVKTKERIKANQAQTELDKLARIQSDTPNFPTSEKVANPVKDAVRNALKLVLNPMFDPKASADIMRNWKKSFAAELQQLGVDETTALTLTDVVGRQIELDSVSKNLDAIDNAINKGALSGVINAIKNTPLADQQKPDWRYEVMRDYLRNAGLPMAQAEKIAKLMDISLKKRFAKAQEEAAASIAKTILKGIKPESNRGFTALIQAIRAQVLNPGSNVAMEFGRAMGWKGFTAEQLKALNEFDSKINDETITEAERAVALEGIKKIIDKVSLPTRVRDAISAFYIGQALGRFTVATVQVIDPIIFSMWDAAVASARNATSPSQVMQIWGNFGSSLINAGREFAFSFKNDVTRSGRLVDYLETQDRKLKRLINDANNLWNSGKYIQAIKKYLFGYPEITSRVLKALDDASFSLLEQNALNQYMISAMNMAKIPKKDQLGALRMVAQARQMDIADMRASGISKNDAIIYANERMKAEISRVMSGLNLNSTEIIDSAINDSLSRIGKTRFKEQLSGDAEFKDEGTLSFPFLKIYEKISQAIGTEKGTQGEVMRIFQRMLVGFPQIVARVANVAYGYTPLSLYRHLLTGRYPLTYGTAIQRRKRLVEQLTGLAVLAPLFFLRSMSFDDDEEKPVRIVFTGFGPVRSKDPEAYNQWNKKHNPGSLEIFIGDKRYALDSKSAGPLKPMIEILGAIDDWQIRRFQDNAKLTKEELKKAQENAGLLSTLGQIAGSFALTAARRGPATGLMQGLIDFRRYPDDPLAAIAQEASFSLTPFLPVVGFGATKNVSDFLSEPIDTRTKEGAILNNLPIIGPMFGKPAINAFGQPIGDIEISEKIRKSIGIPITLVPVSSGDDAKLAKITLKNANGPEPLQRNWFDAKFETPLSDQEWRTVNEDYARSNRKTVLENYEELNGFDPEIYKTAISNVGTASKYLALDNLYKARKKP